MAQTHYDVLGIMPSATPALIRAAYRARIREEHPDQGGDPERAARVNDAYQVLNDEQQRAEYDRGLSEAQVRGADFTSDRSAPAQPSFPEGAAAAPATITVHPRPQVITPLPLWRRTTFLRPVAITAGVWLAAAIGLAVASAHRAAEMQVTEAQGGAPFLVLGAAAVGILALVRVKWWIPVVAVVAYVSFAASMSAGGIGTMMLAITLLAVGVVHVLLRRTRGRMALELVTSYWAAADHPDLSAWFIARHERHGQTTMVQLADVADQAQPDQSATLWGDHRAGSYVIADLTTSPGSVHMTVSATEMRRARRASKARR